MHVFTRSLFTTDLVANDCRVFDWVAAVNKKMMMMCLFAFVVFMFVALCTRKVKGREMKAPAFYTVARCMPGGRL